MSDQAPLGVGTPMQPTKPRGTTGDLYGDHAIWTRIDPRRDLQGRNGLDIFDRMSFDSEIAGSLLHIKSPIVAGEWRIDSAEPGNDEEDAIAQYVRETLMPGAAYGYSTGVQTWSERLEWSLSALEYGFSIMELVWDRRPDGKLYIKRMEPRPAPTVLRWNFDDDGVYQSVTQLGIFPDSTVRMVDLTADTTLIHVFRKFGNNMFGRPFTTPCYLHWYISKHLLELDGILKERFGGIPMAKVKDGVLTEPTEPQMDALKLAFRNFRIHEEQALFLPFPFDGDIVFPGGGDAKLLESVQYHDAQKSKALQTEFLQYGVSQMGGRAVADTKANLLYVGLRGIMQWLEDDYQRQFIVREVDAAFGKRDRYPKLVAPDLEGMRRSAEMAQLMKEYVDARILTPDDTLEDKVREDNKWPKRDPKTARPAPAGGGFGAGGDSGDPQGEAGKILSNRRTRGRRVTLANYGGGLSPVSAGLQRAPFDHERHAFLSGMADYLDRTPGHVYQRAIKNTRNAQIRSVAQAAAKATDAQLAKGSIRVPYIKKMADDLTPELMASYMRGRSEVLDEYRRQTGKTPAPAMTLADTTPDPSEFETEPTDAQAAWVRRLAEGFATAVAAALIDRARSAGQTARNVDGATTQDVQDAVQTALTALSIPRVIANLAGPVTASFTNGRNEQIGAMGDQVETAYYSAIMDQSTCDPCSALDGMEHEPDDPDYATPNPDCEGELNCRCQTIPIFRGSSDVAA